MNLARISSGLLVAEEYEKWQLELKKRTGNKQECVRAQRIPLGHKKTLEKHVLERNLG